MKMLLINKININIRIITLRHYIKSRQFVLTDISPTPTGRAHLKLCIIFGKYPTVCWIFSITGANVQRGTNLDSPLHAAAQKDCISIVKLLLEFGADVNARNLEYKRPVEAAPPGSLTEGFLLIYEGELNVQQHDRLKTRRLLRVLLHQSSSVLFLLQRHPVLCVNCAVSKSGRVWDVPDCIFYHICPSLKPLRTFYNIDNVLMFT